MSKIGKEERHKFFKLAISKEGIKSKGFYYKIRPQYRKTVAKERIYSYELYFCHSERMNKKIVKTEMYLGTINERDIGKIENDDIRNLIEKKKYLKDVTNEQSPAMAVCEASGMSRSQFEKMRYVMENSGYLSNDEFEDCDKNRMSVGMAYRLIKERM